MNSVRPFTHLAALAAACITFLSPCVQGQQEIGFIEEFALAPDREDVLKSLIPGTQDYYYYHALHLEHEGRLAECKAMGLELPGLTLVEGIYQKLIESGHGKSGTQALILALDAMQGV